MPERLSRAIHETQSSDHPEVARLRRAINGSTEGLWEWDTPTGMVWFSPRAHLLLAGDPTAAMPPAWDAVRARMIPEDLDAFNASLDGARELGELDIVFRLRTEFGVRWFRARGASPDQGSPAVTLAGSIQDVDEYRRALDRNAYLAAIVDSSGDAVVGLDHAGNVIAWSEGAARLFDRGSDQVLGRPIESLAPWVRLLLIQDLIPRSLRGEAITGPLVEHRDEAGQMIELATLLAPIRDARGAIVGSSITAEDVTGRRSLERRLVSLGRDLKRRSDELEQFVYTVSHDLKSPLVTCTGYVGLLEEDLDSGDMESARDSARRIRNAVTRMGGLIDDLLKLSRIGRADSLKPRDVPFGQLVEVAEALRHRFEELGARLQIDPDHPETLHTDDRAVSRVLENLLENALKYACDGPNPVVTIGARRATGEVHLFVKDTGPGIDPRYHQKVFGLFQRLDPSKPGTGVGLASVAKVAEALGGRAWVESEPGQGSTFWIALPDRAESDNPRGPSPAAPRNP